MPNRFFFCHLQKTAGSSLLLRLRRHFADSQIYPQRREANSPKAVISVARLLEDWQQRASEIELVAGHFPLCTTDLLGGGFKTFTLLRDPIERTLSYLRHHRRLSLADRHKSLEDIYRLPLRFHGLIHNHMVKMLSMTVVEMTQGALTRVDFSRERLDRAKAALGEIDVIGLQERFDDFCDALAARFGFVLGPPVFANRTQPIGVPESLIARITEDNRDDSELYAFARRLLEERGATRPASDVRRRS